MLFLFQLVPPIGMLNNPMNAVTTKFVRTSTNKVKCPVFVVRVSIVKHFLYHLVKLPRIEYLILN